MCVAPCVYGTLRLSFLWSSVTSFPLFVGLRYTRSRQRTKFISVISLISVIGIALGMTVLITVLSVFNGFQREVRTRMLSAVAHVQVTGLGESLRDWQAVAAAAGKNPHVTATAPYVSAQGLLTSGGNVRGAMLRGIEPVAEEKVSEIGAHMRSGTLESLRSGEYNVVLGAPLARALGVTVGERVVLVAPQGQVTPAGILPRLRQFTVTGTFEVGHYEIDAGLAVVHIEDAQRLYRMDGGVSGVRLKLDDLFLARQVARELLAVLPPEVSVSDWSRFNATYFRAVELEKRMMSLLLFFIIAIAAFNMVSSLYMMVREKQADIAILRTMGASPGEVMRIFMVQGTLIGAIGVGCGIVFGILGALNVDSIIGFIEQVFRVKFMPQDVYQIADLPSELQAGDVVMTAVVAFVLSVLATIYPSWRASKVNPAEALRYE
ncbi:MAG: lipoprotein-releasing ABC transporter permease subunit [Burkholderiales bacterium]|nr:lipoprotein-releasing ABC transporter permease subunit [Burkholderiales bacterium]